MKPKLVVVAILGFIVSIVLISLVESSGGLNREKKNRESSATSITASSEAAVDDFLKIQSDVHSMQWFYSDRQTGLKGVALVIHGLNLRPARMQPIISELTGSGIDVLGLSLRGHGDNYTHSNDIEEIRRDWTRLKTYPIGYG